MKTLLRKNAFTLVEVLIAMGICVVGICSIMVLFPVGVNASRNAAMASYAANAADQILSFAKLCIEEDTGVGGYGGFQYFATNPNDSTKKWTPGTPSTYEPWEKYKPESGYEENHKNETLKNNFNGTSSIYGKRMQKSLETFLTNESTKVTPCDNLVFHFDCGNGTYSDFSCYASMWATPVYADESASPEVVIPFAMQLHVEISWPADLDYDYRQKREYSIEVFKAY